MTHYYAEYTDLFAGEANYCWVHRFKVHAKSKREALTKVKKELFYSPLPRHILAMDSGDMIRADIAGTCIFVMDWSGEDYQTITEIM